MEKENRKEILTKENIEYDIEKAYVYKIKSVTICLVVCLIATFVLCFTIKTNDIISMLIPAILVLLATVILIWWIALLLKYINKNYKYTIEKDCFIGSGVHRIATQRMPCLKFKSFGNFIMDNEVTYYTWSKVNQMSNKTLKSTSTANDEFYVIIINGKIVNVYNTKFFEFNDEV